MMRKGLFAAGVAAALLLAFAPNARAQSGIYLGLQGGLSAQNADLGEIDFENDTSFAYGVRGGVRLLNFAVELSFLQASHTLDPDDFGDQIDWNYFGLNGKLFLPIPVVSPYLTVGYGYYNVDVSAIGDDRTGGFNLGAGLEIGLGRKFSLTAEGKYHRFSADLDAGEFNATDFTVTGGFNVYF